ncbi:hypothetical protein [Symmachiella dynata]|uniref:hypothetical protein n=1 Tax=Symmachiella dynata TaxID=2527995 RepID=UPI0030ED3C20|tara:strand:+ start:152 stop:361 length:210 start_codon:yes stop_codon:yes gene_type:complete
MPSIFSTREVAEILGTQEWRVRRLFEDGTLPEPDRFAGKRAIPRESLPLILDKLRDRGWISNPGASQCT